MANQAWDLEVDRHAAAYPSDSFNSIPFSMTTTDRKRSRVSSMSDGPALAFTLLNNPPCQAINPKDILLVPGLQYDSPYTIPQEQAPAASRLKTKKQMNATKGVSVSFTHLWQFEDEEDLDHNETDEPPKRRTTLPRKRAQSGKLSDTSRLTNTSDSTTEAMIEEVGRLPLGLPPKSGKRIKSGSTCVAPKDSTKGNTPFKKPAITKASAFRKKEVSQELPTSCTLSQYHGYTTTENAVKLSQTTMEKLNAFRFRAPQTEPHEFVLPQVARPPSVGFEYGVPRDRLSSKYGLTINGNHTGAVLGNGIISQQHDSQLEPLSTDIQATENDVTDALGSQSSPSLITDIAQHCQEGVEMSSWLLKSDAKQLHDEYGSEELDACLNELFNELMTDNDVVALKQRSQTTTNKVEATSCFGLPTQIQNTCLNTSNESNLSPSENQVEKPELPNVVALSRKIMQSPDTYNDRFYIKTKPSDSAQKRTSSKDEFDDGVDDDDLLAAVEEPVFLQTHIHSRSFATEHIHVTPQKPSQDPETSSMVLNSSPIMNSNASSQILVRGKRSQEMDDEFSTDLLDDDDLLNISEAALEVDESFIPPTSVQHAFDEDREVYDSSLQFSPLKTRAQTLCEEFSNDLSAWSSQNKHHDVNPFLDGAEEDWSFVQSNDCTREKEVNSPSFTRPKLPVRRTQVTNPHLSNPVKRTISAVSTASTSATQETENSGRGILDDSHEYEPLRPFVRPLFPSLVMDRSPVIGLSAQIFLRTCFRIGEMFQQGIKYNVQKKDAVIELFARVNFSSREPGTTKQHFQFLDLWNDRPPYPNGILASFKSTGLAESESKAFLDRSEIKLARVLGRLMRDKKNETWWLQIINIRETDWEEIRWTKRIISGDDIVRKLETNGPSEGWLVDLLG